MSKVAVVYWSGTGNTAAMAGAVEEGAKKRGAEVSVFGPEKFTADMVSEYDGIAFGCPAMGAEVLEESVFDPMFTDIEGSLHRSGISFLTDDLTLVILLFLIQALGSSDGQITVIKFNVYVFLLEARQIHQNFIVVIMFLDICQHFSGSMLAIQLTVYIFQTSEREVIKPVIK